MPSDLINTLEAPGEFDALSTLRPGEPYILFVGRDRLAPPLVDHWADQNRRRALAEYDAGRITKEKRDEELRKSTQAEMIAASMVEYKNKWKASTEALAEPRPTYTGHTLPEDTQRRDKLQAARARASASLSNSVAELATLRDLEAADEADRIEVYRLDAAMSAMRQLADEIVPPRPIPGVRS
jgi:uncharacterized protein YecA (UPF0149 family)